MTLPHGDRFLALHRAAATFVLPNAWDPGSGKVLAHQGFPAPATTSAGMALFRGLPDDGSIGRARVVEQVAAIAAAVDVPVSADRGGASAWASAG